MGKMLREQIYENAHYNRCGASGHCRKCSLFDGHHQKESSAASIHLARLVDRIVHRFLRTTRKWRWYRRAFNRSSLDFHSSTDSKTNEESTRIASLLPWPASFLGS